MSKIINDKPLVSVCMITYGHENFIKEAVESVLMQECQFEFELVIADDCSPNNTKEIINELKLLNPKGKHIKYTKHSKNQGMCSNFKWALEQCAGKYIALCEGDDYWTDPLKLQKQVNFLDQNSDFILCFTNAIEIVMDKTSESKMMVYNSDRIFSHRDMPIQIPTLTAVFRNYKIKELNFGNSPGADLLLWIWLSKFGKIKYLNSITGVYRCHENGIYTSKSQIERKQHLINTRIEALKLIDDSILIKFYLIIFYNIHQIKIIDNNISISTLRELRVFYESQRHKFDKRQILLFNIKFRLFEINKFYKNRWFNSLNKSINKQLMRTNLK
jgi:glycosyltransferase involved in cell wall biosynthesis